MVDAVGHSTNPVLSVTTVVAEYNLVLVDGLHVAGTIEAFALIKRRRNGLHHNRASTAVPDDLLADLACGCTESLLLRGNKTSVAWQIVLSVVWRPAGASHS